MKFVREITRPNDIYVSAILAAIWHIWQIWAELDLANKAIKNHSGPGYIRNVMAMVTVV